MKQILIATLFLFLSACTSIPDDYSMPPVEAEFYTAELHSSCGTDVGILGCSLDGDLKNKFLSFPVIYKGNFEIISKRCNFKMKKSFSKTGWFKISWAKLTKDMGSNEFACIFNVRVKTDGVRSRLGQFMLMDSEEFEPAEFELLGRKSLAVSWFQYKRGSLSSIELKIANKGVKELEIVGCGIDRRIQGNSIDISSLIEAKSCALEIAGITEDNEMIIGSFIMRQYSDKYVSLPDPVIEYKKKRLKIKADKVVGIISVGDKFKKSNKISAKVKENQEVFVRILTSNGRFRMYKIKNGEVIWTY